MQDSVERRKALKRSNLAEKGPNLVKNAHDTCSFSSSAM